MANANVTLGGNPISVNGNFPKSGDTALEFTLTARAAVVLDENNRVLRSKLVPEIKQEPDYDARGRRSVPDR